METLLHQKYKSSRLKKLQKQEREDAETKEVNEDEECGDKKQIGSNLVFVLFLSLKHLSSSPENEGQIELLLNWNFWQYEICFCTT